MPIPAADSIPRPDLWADNLAVWEKSLEFLDAPRFKSAYRRGMFSGHFIARPERRTDADPETDLHIEWRVAICCWAGWHARRLRGDFVECGVNTGIFSLAVCEYIDFNSTGKAFWLFDTFAGIPEAQMSTEERAADRSATHVRYRDCYERAKANFAPFANARLVRGVVPDTLSLADIAAVAYLSIDMNTAYPERAALEHFWPKLVPGGVVVLDDYGWRLHAAQKRALDEFAASVGVEIWSLPTGQGLLIKS